MSSLRGFLQPHSSHTYTSRNDGLYIIWMRVQKYYFQIDILGLQKGYIEKKIFINMNLALIRAIYSKTDNLLGFIGNLQQKIHRQYSVFIEDKKWFMTINNEFIQIRENFLNLLTELNSHIVISKFNSLNSSDRLYIRDDDVNIKLQLIKTECEKIKEFLKEYQKYDDELTYIFENVLHERVKDLALDLFQRRDYLNAIRNVFFEINDTIKKKYKKKTGNELDGYNLMVNALNPDNSDCLAINSLSSQTDIDIQKGYRWLFVGSILAIRNPIAHKNLSINKNEAIHYLVLGSDLFHTIDKLR